MRTTRCAALRDRSSDDRGGVQRGNFRRARGKVTGDSEEKRDPRHAHSVCLGCLGSYCEREIESGKNFVKCPMCPRSLQVRAGPPPAVVGVSGAALSVLSGVSAPPAGPRGAQPRAHALL
jgi:hypothetical protein